MNARVGLKGGRALGGLVHSLRGSEDLVVVIWGFLSTGFKITHDYT